MTNPPYTGSDHAAAVQESGLSGMVEAAAEGNIARNQSAVATDAVRRTSFADSSPRSSQPLPTSARTRPSDSSTAGRPSQLNQDSTDAGIEGSPDSDIGPPAPANKSTQPDVIEYAERQDLPEADALAERTDALELEVVRTRTDVGENPLEEAADIDLFGVELTPDEEAQLSFLGEVVAEATEVPA